MTEITPLHKAFITIQKLKKLLLEQHNKRLEPIAIVGLSGRFPEAVNKTEFWNLLCEGRNIISHFPEERWTQLQGTEEIVLKNDSHPYWGGYLSNIDKFDAYFFGISPREAVMMDPQQRLLLEVMYEAFEDAGIPLDSLIGSNTGIFASLYASQFGRMQKLENDIDALYIPTGNAISIAANRFSYLFDLRGPSLVFDTACSSSLVATHIACLNLQNKLCDLAVVASANINLLPSTNYLLSKAKMLSPDGQCKTFDAGANGYVQGEGVGAIILKPLSHALRDKDRVYSLITGMAINQDGKTNGLTAPSGLQQADLLRKAYKNAKIDPKEVAYIECHGTGTFLGDPIEAQALGEVIGENRDSQSPCLIGSVKTNIGHLEPAAGIASLIKVALALKNNFIPPHLNFHVPNPHVDFKKYHFKIVDKMESWPQYGSHKIAGISGFGFGGTNAHIIMQEAPLEIPDTTARDRELFTLSAKSMESLKELIQKWYDYLSQHRTINISQLCYSSHVRRSHYSFRLAIIVKNTKDLIDSLYQLLKDFTYKAQHIYITEQEIRSGPDKVEIEKNIDLDILASHYIKNENIDWKKYEEDRQYWNLDMPLYAWQSKSYWPKFKDISVISNTNLHPLAGLPLSSPLSDHEFEFSLNTQKLPELSDTYHIVHAGYYLEMLAFICQSLGLKEKFEVQNLVFLSALIIPHHTEVKIHIILNSKGTDKWDFTFFSQSGNNRWVKNATGILIPNVRSEKGESIEAIRQRCTTSEPSENLYNKILRMGMPAGESIRWTKNYWLGKDEMLCEFEEPSVCQTNKTFILNAHPGIIDGAIQPIFKLIPDHLVNPYMAASFGKIKIGPLKKGNYFLHVKLKEITKDNKIMGESRLYNDNSEILAEFDQLLLSPLDKKIELTELLKEQTNVLSELSDMPEETRKEFIINFLTEQSSIIFSIPKEDINTNVSLREMGIDSLMGLVLLKTLENNFHVNYPMESLLQGPSLMELTDYILKNSEFKPSISAPALIPPPKTNWIAYREATSSPKMRLFCFPYGGGSASIYKDWQHALSQDIEVCPIQYPGRENRLNEKPIDNLDKLLDIMIKELEGYWDRPFVFFGHSMGGLIAYELSCRLREMNRPLPQQLFISAFPDPRLPTKGLDRLLNQLKDHHINISNIDNSNSIDKLSDQQLIVLSRSFAESGLTDYKDYLLNKEISKILLPIFVSDMKLIHGYEYKPKAPLELPITVFLSKNDPWIPYEDHLTWSELTTTKCKIIEYTHGHLFIKDKEIKKNMISKIQQSIQETNKVD